VSLPLFIFKRDAIAAELSSLKDNTFLVQLYIRSADGLPVRPEVVILSPEAFEDFAISPAAGLTYEEGMEIPDAVAIMAVEDELERNGCQLRRDPNPVRTVQARWTWPPLT
jgi:hypothetical protein